MLEKDTLTSYTVLGRTRSSVLYGAQLFTFLSSTVTTSNYDVFP